MYIITSMYIFYFFLIPIDDHSEVELSRKTTVISYPTKKASEFASILKILEKDEAENLSTIKVFVTT